MFWFDLACAALLLAVLVSGVRWLWRLRALKRGSASSWWSVLMLLGSGALVWKGRPYVAEQILIAKHDIIPMKQNIRGLPRGLSTWLMRLGIHPVEVMNWSSGEGLSRRKLASTEELRAAMRLLAVCKPRVFTLSCSQLGDFRPLNELRGLEQLYLYGTILPEAPLPQLASVGELRTTGCKFTDFQNVAAIAPNATVLRVNELAIREVNVRGLEKLQRLEHLDIRYCQVVGHGVDEILDRIPRVQRYHDQGIRNL
jgi:hypothetical protein